METILVIMSVLNFILGSIFIYIFLYKDRNNENKMKNHIESIISKIDISNNLVQDKLSENSLSITNNTSQLKKSIDNNKIEVIREFKIQIDEKSIEIINHLNLAFKQLEEENNIKTRTILDNVSNNFNDFKESNMLFIKKINEIITTNSEEIKQMKLEVNQLKHELKIDIGEILKEIKAPLDLD